MVEHSPGYLADHWCLTGHILFRLDVELYTELDDGRDFILTSGMSYPVADNTEPHHSSTKAGDKLFVVVNVSTHQAKQPDSNLPARLALRTRGLNA